MKKRKYTSYKTELNQDLARVNRKIEAAEKLVYNNLNPNNEHWQAAYSSLNDLRLKRKTIQSRIDNLDRGSSPTQVYQLPNINNNK
jgi:hypothetical protein